MKWLSKSDVAKEENPDGKKNLSDALTNNRFSQPQREEILASCEGYEQDIFNHFFHEAIVSEPAPCGNDALIMFASAPGTLSLLIYISFIIWIDICNIVFSSR